MGYTVFKKLAQKLSADRERIVSLSSNPINCQNREQIFLNKMTKNAVNLYEKQADIKKFTNLVLSDPENDSHNKLVDALFSHGIVNISEEDEKLSKLSDNTRFLKDLGLID